MYQDHIKTVNSPVYKKYFCDQCKVRTADSLHTLIATHYCASFSEMLLIALDMLSWIWRSLQRECAN